MKVEVVRALPHAAEVVSVELPAGATVRDSLAACGIRTEKPVGIFGRRVALDHKLSDGDRVEIYRPLEIDPKEARRRRAKKKR